MNKQIFIFLVLISFISGCASHSPMSEMYMFKEKEAKDGRIYDAKYSHALASITADFYPQKKVEDFAKKQRELAEGLYYDYQSIPTFTTNSIFISESLKNVAFSLAVGNAIGFDSTIELDNSYYLTSTINISEKPQGGFILQRRLLDGNPTGLSIGTRVDFKHQNIRIVGYDCSLCFPAEEFYSTSIGMRLVLTKTYITPYQTSRLFFYLTGSVNYDITMNLLYPRIGVSLGIY